MAAHWPTSDELAQVIDVENVEDWADPFLDNTCAAAIYKVKSDVGDWVEETDEPDESLAHAALRLAELIALKPEVAASVVTDPTYRYLLQGHRRKFGIS